MASLLEKKHEYDSLIEQASELVNRLSVVAEKAEQAMQNDALQYAAETSRLDHITLILTILGMVIALGGVFAFYEVQHRARATAKAAADEQVPNEVLAYMKENSGPLVAECLKDPEIVSALQIEMMRLGIRDAPSAGDVDTDAENRETGNE